jgi:hypothetical protein
MRRGDEIIYQGYLEYGEFGGYPDFLVRVERPSELGAWSYARASISRPSASS